MRREHASPHKEDVATPALITSGISGAPSRFIPALLWLCILGWVFRNTVFLRQRGDFSAVDVSAGIQIALVIVVFIAIIMSARGGPMWLKTAGVSVRLLFIYYFICIISAIWSGLPSYTLYRAFEYITLLVGTLVALSYSASFLTAEKRALVISMIVILLGMYVNFHFYGFHFNLKVWHTNSYTASAAMIFCYCLGEYFYSDKKRKKVLKWIGIFALATLIIGTSSASYISALIGIVFVAILHRKKALIYISSFMLILLIIVNLILTIDFSALNAILFPGKNAQAISTFSGRTLMWERFFSYIQESPLIGHGFDVISTGRGQMFKSSPHNSLFSILLGTGLVGLSVALFYGYRLFREFFQTTRYKVPGSIGCGAGLSAGLANSLSMPMIFDDWNATSLTFACMTGLFIVFVVIPDKQQKAARNAIPRYNIGKRPSRMREANENSKLASD